MFAFYCFKKIMMVFSIYSYLNILLVTKCQIKKVKIDVEFDWSILKHGFRRVIIVEEDDE